MQDFTPRISALRTRLAEAEGYLRVAELRARRPQLETELGRPDLWDEPESAQALQREFAELSDDLDLFDRLESRVDDVDTLAELKPGRELYANVEFYAGVVMDRCGLPREMFTPTFASSRVIGWCANILEQAGDNRIIRPSARYVGPPPPQPVPEP